MFTSAHLAPPRQLAGRFILKVTAIVTFAV